MMRIMIMNMHPDSYKHAFPEDVPEEDREEPLDSEIEWKTPKTKAEYDEVLEMLEKTVGSLGEQNKRELEDDW